MDSNQKSGNTVMGVLSYLGILVLIPLITDARKDPFVKFHIKQGLVLLICEVIVSFFYVASYSAWMLMQIIQLVLFVMVIFGIVNVVNGKMKELPLIGGLAKFFKF